MSELRIRMIRDMTVRGFSPRTHEAYIRAVVGLAKYYRRPPDQLTHDEVQAYLAHLIQERKLAWSSCSQAAHALRFLYPVTLGHERAQFQVPAPRQPQTLPEILSRAEVWRLLARVSASMVPGLLFEFSRLPCGRSLATTGDRRRARGSLSCGHKNSCCEIGSSFRTRQL